MLKRLLEHVSVKVLLTGSAAGNTLALMIYSNAQHRLLKISKKLPPVETVEAKCHFYIVRHQSKALLPQSFLSTGTTSRWELI